MEAQTNAKITWAMLVGLATLAFYTGGIDSEVKDNTKTNVSQWVYINANKEINQNLIKLTEAVKSSDRMQERDRDDGRETKNALDDLSEKMNSLQMDVTRIKTTLEDKTP